MPKDEKARKVSIGFDGGQVLALRLSQSSLDELRSTLKQDDGGWVELSAVDGEVLLDARQLVFLRVDSDELRVGF